MYYTELEVVHNEREAWEQDFEDGLTHVRFQFRGPTKLSLEEVKEIEDAARAFRAALPERIRRYGVKVAIESEELRRVA